MIPLAHMGTSQGDHIQMSVLSEFSDPRGQFRSVVFPRHESADRYEDITRLNLRHGLLVSQDL
jgi:hypothetical protein